MNTKVLLIASSLLTVMNGVNIGQALEYDNLFEPVMENNNQEQSKIELEQKKRELNKKINEFAKKLQFKDFNNGIKVINDITDLFASTKGIQEFMRAMDGDGIFDDFFKNIYYRNIAENNR